MTDLSTALKTLFQADEGAYSVVTHREANGDKSVTLDRDEKAVLCLRYDQEDITRAGGGPPDGKPNKQNFNVFDYKKNTHRLVSLALKFPKSQGNELRLYFAKNTGFYPEEGNVFFIFTRKNEAAPFIGYTSEMEWDAFSSNGVAAIKHENDYLVDEEDDDYQKSINSSKPPMNLRSKLGNVYDRNPNLAVNALNAAGYKCEYNPEHRTFISASKMKPYMEAHHLIPVSKTNMFEISLDIKENIVSLCPNCHSQIHFADTEERSEIINCLYKKRTKALTEVGLSLSLEQIYEFYGV